jgi:hypothetical protein
MLAIRPGTQRRVGNRKVPCSKWATPIIIAHEEERK